MELPYARQPLGAVACFVCAWCLPMAATGAAGADDGTSASSEHGVVVAVSRPACAAGVEMLTRGGNAVDAAVATALALTVTYPEAASLAGGGFMLVKPADEREPLVIDYRETAPVAITPKSLALDPSASDHRWVGTPGAARGLGLAHERFGRLPWPVVVEPALRLARDGFELDEATARSLNHGLQRVGGQDEFYRVYRRPEGGEWRSGLRLVQPDLAASLAILAAEGPDSLYTGSLAPPLLAEVASGAGLLTADDLAAYTAVIRPPIHGVYRGHDVYSAPPPCAGGVALVEMLNIVEPFGLGAIERWSPFTLHLTTEAMRRATADAAKFLGDPEFDETPLHLTSKQYARRISERIDTSHPTLAREIGPAAALPDSTGATHFAVVDAAGMAVSNVFGLERSFGVSIVVPGAGILLNSALVDFRSTPDRGRRDESREPNESAPGKRMLSPLTPAIVCRDGKLKLLAGAAGGRSSASVVLTLLTNMLDFQMDPAAALDAPRWRPREGSAGSGQGLEFEGYPREAYAGAARGLQFMGYTLEPPHGPLGDAQAIRVGRGAYEGAADRRRSGAALGCFPAAIMDKN